MGEVGGCYPQGDTTWLCLLLATESLWLPPGIHYKKVALSQVGLSQLQLQYKTMGIPSDPLHCLAAIDVQFRTVGLLSNEIHKDQQHQSCKK